VAGKNKVPRSPHPLRSEKGISQPVSAPPNAAAYQSSSQYLLRSGVTQRYVGRYRSYKPSAASRYGSSTEISGLPGW